MTRLAVSPETEFAAQLDTADICYEAQYKWHPSRKFRADFCIQGPSTKQRDWFLVEIDGGTWLPNTGHNSGTGKTRDCIKDAEALLLGYVTMRFTPGMVRNGSALDYVKRYLEA